MSPADEADEPVRIVDYDPSWPVRFARERALLETAIAPWISGGVHHVGSTAVAGLRAKPTIDILVGVEDLESAKGCFDRLAALEYLYAPYRADEMHWFCKPDPRRRSHHLHLIPVDSARFTEEIRFRDLLRADPSTAQAYADLKVRLAEQFKSDRDGYTEAKGTFIVEILREAP